MNTNPIKIIECPRDAMQGLKEFIATDTKVAYINQLLQCGFDTIDFGSFVSPKAIPQMADTAEVLSKLDLSKSKTKLLAIIANKRGAEEAAKHKEIHYLGFPLSVSETFQQRNTNKSIAEAIEEVAEIQAICTNSNKELVCYISMGFGNPYGDAWDTQTVEKFVEKLDAIGVKIISLSDTIGVSNPENITYLFSSLIPKFPHIEFGAHLHTNPNTWEEKVEAAFNAGCMRFDGAIKGFGGCPMAKDELVGNMNTENLVDYFLAKNANLAIHLQSFKIASDMANSVFYQAIAH
jgi:hydroxymethylglutaryl-CoA lyase